MATAVKVYLVAHSNANGTGIAQATVFARGEQAARSKFEQQHPERTVQTISDRDKS